MIKKTREMRNYRVEIKKDKTSLFYFDENGNEKVADINKVTKFRKMLANFLKKRNVYQIER